VGRIGRAGFTFIELLIVVVIIGILATIAIPKFANTKTRAYIASMKSDLRNLLTSEESFFADSIKYGSATSCTTPPTVSSVNFCPSSGNNIAGPIVNGGGWSATMTNSNVTNPLVTCAIFVNTPAGAPATTEGVAACQ
jgi:prepilin-type N-terminal cleavage/methylation domain-containing protein